MPNRILKESICTSDNLDSLSTEAEAFFYRLLVQCDDYGRMDARPPILLSRCYPLRLDRVTIAMVSQWLDQLRRAELITLYTVAGKPYLQFTTWDKHQQVRAQRSKYPAIADGLIADDSNGNQLQSNVPVIQSNPIQSESESESESESLSNHSADKPRQPLSETQQRVLSAFNAKRFKNDIQRDAVLKWSDYPQETVNEAITWAATKGFALGQAIENISRALPKWNTPKQNGNGNGRKPTEYTNPMLEVIKQAQQRPDYGN